GGSAGAEARAQAWGVGGLGQARERDHALEAASERARCLERAQWRRGFVEIALGVALVRSDGEAMAVRQFEEGAPFLEARDHAGRVARSAQIDQPGAGPDFVGYRRPVAAIGVLRLLGEVPGSGTGQQG